MTKQKGADDLLITRDERIRIDWSQRLSHAACDVLRQFGEPPFLIRQLHKLNSFERSGHLILFGDYVNHRRINFENQVGGHGCLGGEQQAPFILVKREHKLDTSDIADATELYPPLRQLRDRLLT